LCDESKNEKNIACECNTVLHVCCATDTTRGVYQRKLQRWLQYGPTADSSMSESIEVEPHVDVVRSKVAAVDETSSMDHSHSNGIKDGPGSKQTACDTKLKNLNKVPTVTAEVPVHPKHNVSPVRMSKSEVMPQVQPYSMTFAECGSESFTETDNGWFAADQLMKERFMKPKAKSITADQPVVTQS